MWKSFQTFCLIIKIVSCQCDTKAYVYKHHSWNKVWTNTLENTFFYITKNLLIINWCRAMLVNCIWINPGCLVQHLIGSWILLWLIRWFKSLTNHNSDESPLTNHISDESPLTNHISDESLLTNHNSDESLLTNHISDESLLTNHNSGVRVQSVGCWHHLSCGQWSQQQQCEWCNECGSV